MKHCALSELRPLYDRCCSQTRTMLRCAYWVSLFTIINYATGASQDRYGAAGARRCAVIGHAHMRVNELGLKTVEFEVARRVFRRFYLCCLGSDRVGGCMLLGDGRWSMIMVEMADKKIC